MQLAKQTYKRIYCTASVLVIFICAKAQENSPFSRYGLGDLYPNQHIAVRAMGGMGTIFASDQALNAVNPASYSALRFINIQGASKGALITYDIGISIDARTLRSAVPNLSYKSTNFSPSYIMLGVPLSAKADSRKRNAGLVFGLRPATRINYSVQNNSRIPIDSIQTLYEGKGGLNQVFIGIGKKWNNFSIGLNAGYQFGKKDITTKVIFQNDTVNYYKSNFETNTDFWGFFFTPGFMYNIRLKEIKATPLKNYNQGYFLRLGASATLAQTLKASGSLRRETFAYDESAGTVTIDSVYEAKNLKGEIKLPLAYNAGIQFSKKLYIAGDVALTKWSIGAEYNVSNWTDYRYYDKTDEVVNSSMFRVGGEFLPSPFSTSFFRRSTYRFGFYSGKDYLNADGRGYKIKAFTFGMGFNVKKWNNYTNQSTQMNIAVEVGKRGTKVNNVTENFFKISYGLSLSDIWFIKRKYD